MVTGLGMSRGSNPNMGGDRISNFANGKSIKPLFNSGLLDAIRSPVKFKISNITTAYGYPATMLADICDVVLTARNEGILQAQQQHIAQRCELLVRGFARVGIIALVDEATGYQELRAKTALATILEKFIARELQPWTKTFPYEFYEQIFRLREWGRPEGVKRPGVIGKYTNDFVYERLAPGVLDELRTINPIISKGYRKHKHFQWFTTDLGHPKLKEHLAAVIALMRASSTWDKFKNSLNRALPKKGETIPIDIDSD